MARKTTSKEQETRKVFETINTVEGFEPKYLAQEYTDVQGNTSLNIPVKDRVSWFRLVHTEGSIVTKLISDDGKKAVMKAYVYGNGKTFLATGTGTAFYSESSFGQSYVECAETKAIGRALGFAGFGTQFCNDFELPENVPIDTGIPTTNHNNEAKDNTQKSSGSLFEQASAVSLEEKVESLMETIKPALSKKMIIPYGPCATMTISDVYKAEKGDDKLETLKQYAYPENIDEKYIEITAACRVFINACLSSPK